MKLLLISAFLWANASHAHVKCLTDDQKYKVEVIESQNKSNQPLLLQYSEKSSNQYVVKLQEKVEMHEDIDNMQIAISGLRSQLVISIDGNLFDQQSSRFVLDNRRSNFKCDIED